MKKKSHCPYCALQCGVVLDGPPDDLYLEGDPDFSVNAGALCVKGWTAARLLDHPERLTRPLLRRRPGGALVPGSWPQALGRIASALRETQERHGRDAVGLFGGGSLTNEKAYLLGKLARFALRTANIDYNGRFCMSSGASAGQMALGIDRGLPFPLADIPLAETVLLVGGNPAETMPPLMRYFEEQRKAGGALIVVDPRRSVTAEAAALHLRLSPGSDAALANGILHVLIRDRLVDAEYVGARTEGFDSARALAATYWPERVERLTGVPQGLIEDAARRLGHATRAMILTSRGAEQQAHGVANVLAYINVALALGLPGRRGSGYGTVTGQGNGQGGREHGQKADQLPGYRHVEDTVARAHIARVWGMAPADLPRSGLSAYELLDSIGTRAGVRALLVMGSNPAVSAPRASHVIERLAALDFLVVSDFFLSETAQLADVVLPAAQWAEEDGTTTNLEGRVIRRRAVRVPPETCAPTSRSSAPWAAPWARPRLSPSARPATSSRSCAVPQPVDPPTTPASPTTASTGTVVSSGPARRKTIPARRACLLSLFRHPRAGLGSTRSSIWGPWRGSTRPIRFTSRRAASSCSISPVRRRGAWMS